jgi:mannobiose 2-epimerase
MLNAGIVAGTPRPHELRGRIERELLGNILPFWMRHAVDRSRGGFYGGVTNELRARNDVPRSAVLCARVLWTYAAAYSRYRRPEYLEMAGRARGYLELAFWDRERGGVFWSVDLWGRPVDTRKHTYAQAFAIYGLTEHARATGDRASLRLARLLFDLLEAHAYDEGCGAYIEARAQAWGPTERVQLSAKEPASHTSMNTLLHVLEAYTSLLRAWEDDRLRERHRQLVELFLSRVIDPATHHFRLFFDAGWRPLGDEISLGHDIEGSWLLVEAAAAQGDAALLERARAAALAMAAAVYAEGLAPGGGLRGEERGGGSSWWAQAEAAVGFYNAYQLSGDERYARAAAGCWAFIERHHVDRVNGDWFKLVGPDGQPDDGALKVGPWECPYHHARACYELLDRLGARRL